MRKIFHYMKQVDFYISIDSIPEASVLLDLWLDKSSTDERRAIGLKGEPSYRYFWNTWMSFLGSGENCIKNKVIAWNEVSAIDVKRFLNSGPRGRKRDTQPSLITKRRYWRLLERIYAFAQENGWVLHNPATQIALSELPPSEDPRGVIIQPRLWYTACHILSQGGVDNGILTVRNRAICSVVFELALMPMELRSLTLESLVYRETEQGRRQLYALQINGDGVAQQRKLVVSDYLRSVLEDWLVMRRNLIKERSSQVLLCSRVGAVLTPMQLINIISQLLRRAASESSYPLPARLGPQVVRNTRLVMWLNEGQAPSQVAVWAGLKDVHGLYHLRQHVNPEILLPSTRRQN